ncbi:hypothetical protein PV327_009654 [Microctonus hyperodae]|uniref:Transmembrane protein 70 n=1 Tax=Microctonus hyperodae TaxID=165561 RepID=A0AA39CB56_MICHY|nr:hypothetical protein PV327_009654 [Microctonus hyperodae]
MSFLVTGSGKNNLKTIAPVIQKRWLSDQNEMKNPSKYHPELVYHGPLAKKIKMIKLFSISTSLFNLTIQPYLLPRILDSGSIAATVTAALCFGFFIVVTPILLHVLTKKYVIDIYYDKEKNTYTASVYTFLAQLRKIEFTPHDVEQPELRQMLTNCYIKGQPLLLDFSNFLDPIHYSTIMGYDKPMNFQLDTDKSTSVNSTFHVDNQQQTAKYNEKKSMRN